jgi:hypothetical protein
VDRLEALLFARTRSHSQLLRELERKDRLLREGLLRMSTSTSQEFSALRAGYDAAVARAIEAEVAKAELTFALDETRAQLTAAAPEVGRSVGVGARDRATAVYANGAGLIPPAADSRELAALRAQLEALRGERNGLQARMLEAENAWQAAHGLTQKVNQRLSGAQTRVDELRAETAELTLLAQTRAARIVELTQASGLDQQEVRALRAQVATATAAQVAQSEAREADRSSWSERLGEHAEREQAAWKAATEAVARSESRLREFLGTLQQPLQELDVALDTLNAVEQRAPRKSAMRTTRASARQQPEEQASAANVANVPRAKSSSADE